MVIKRKRNTNDAILAVSGRDILERELAMYFEKTTCRWSIVGDAKDTCITLERREILEVLGKTAGTLDAQEIHGGLEQMGVSKTPAAVRWLLRQMVEAGEIENPVRGKYRIPAATSTNIPTSQQQTNQQAGLFPENDSCMNQRTNKQTYQQTNKCYDEQVKDCLERNNLLVESESSTSSELLF